MVMGKHYPLVEIHVPLPVNQGVGVFGVHVYWLKENVTFGFVYSLFS